MPKQNTYQEGNLSKLLIAITLFVSVFSLSGDFGNAAPSKTKSFQTELIHSPKNTTSKTISYSKASSFIFAKSQAIDLCYDNIKHIALFHSYLSRTYLRVAAKDSFSDHNPKLPVKVIPQSADEDAFPTRRA
ncbi:MAG: hypothetical protein IPJ74_23965 [Saprospiraceae bacterium]|nr:hypothetical protein [Saprospiraceae bacterium]